MSFLKAEEFVHRYATGTQGKMRNQSSIKGFKIFAADVMQL